MKTAEEILSEIAGNNPDYLNFDICIKAMHDYANQKLDEAAEKANLIGDYWSRECDECEFFDTEHGIRMSVNKQSILQLKDL